MHAKADVDADTDSMDATATRAAAAAAAAAPPPPSHDAWNLDSRMRAWESTQRDLDEGGVSLLAMGRRLRRQQRLRACAEADARSLRVTMVATLALLVLVIGIACGVLAARGSGNDDTA